MSADHTPPMLMEIQGQFGRVSIPVSRILVIEERKTGLRLPGEPPCQITLNSGDWLGPSGQGKKIMCTESYDTVRDRYIWLAHAACAMADPEESVGIDQTPTEETISEKEK